MIKIEFENNDQDYSGSDDYQEFIEALNSSYSYPEVNRTAVNPKDIGASSQCTSSSRKANVFQSVSQSAVINSMLRQ